MIGNEINKKVEVLNRVIHKVYFVSCILRHNFYNFRNADPANNENADPIPLIGLKRHSTSCQALVPSWKKSAVDDDESTNFTPNITYPSGSRG